MEFKSQIEPIKQLQMLADSHRQSLLIEGPAGCGKSYLSRAYGQMLEIHDVVQVPPKVADLKSAIEGTMSVDNDIVLCIENLDTGVSAASYSILKFLEEPLSNVFIVITCRNIKFVPDTIISRSTVVSVGPPTNDDLKTYAVGTNPVAYNSISNTFIWQCVRTFNDVDAVLKMNSDELSYYMNLQKVCSFKDSVSNTVWAISHYTHNNSECNLELSIRSIISICNNPFITRCGIECIRELNQGRIAKHAILSKFVFNAKYCE